MKNVLKHIFLDNMVAKKYKYILMFLEFFWKPNGVKPKVQLLGFISF